MADRPILFSGPMVRAILDGHKTQTRRVMKPWPGYQSEWLTMDVLHRSPTCYLAVVDGDFGVQMQHPLAGQTVDGIENDSMSPLTWVRLPYAPGERLWVREAWRTSRAYDDLAPSEMGGEEPVNYEADGALQTWGWADHFDAGRFRPGMFMPRWSSRLTLAVADVRVQRLQEISEADARAEGVLWVPGHGEITTADLHEGYSNYLNCVQGFEVLWDSLNAKRGYGWDANPWVCAITFKAHRCNIDQMPAPPQGNA